MQDDAELVCERGDRLVFADAFDEPPGPSQDRSVLLGMKGRMRSLHE